MIKFPCKCGFQFEVAQERAGEPLQCPRCMILNEVPLLSDLADLENDGTIRMEPISREEQGAREEELRRTYLPRRQDETGNDIDMRNTFQQYVNAGADDVPLELKDNLRPGTPKYDPVSGELIKPLAMRGEEARPVIPIASGPPTLHYEKNYFSPAQAIWRAPMLLFTPGSSAVLLIMVAVHISMLAVWVLVGGGLIWAGFIPFFVYMMTIAHVANIIEETGPEEKDELPTPMRGASWYEDIWLPFFRFLTAFAICHAPAFLAIFFLKAHSPATVALFRGLFLAGSFFFPAALLIVNTSGTYINLRPDRILGTIGAIGIRYGLVVLLWLVSAWLLVEGTLRGIVWAASLVALDPPAVAPPNIGITLAEITFGMYLIHMFSWILGGLYRSCHPKFPWVYQRYITPPKIKRRKVRPHRPRKVTPKVHGILAPELPPPKLQVRPVQE
jgi:hypothetical protein